MIEEGELPTELGGICHQLTYSFKTVNESHAVPIKFTPSGTIFCKDIFVSDEQDGIEDKNRI